MRSIGLIVLLIAFPCLVFSSETPKIRENSVEFSKRLGAWQGRMDKAVEELRELEARSHGAQGETQLSKVEALLDTAKERVAVLNEEKRLLEEGLHLLRDIDRSKEKLSTFASIKQHVRDDILTSPQAVTDEMVNVAKLETDIASANSQLREQQVSEVHASLRLNTHESKQLLQKFNDAKAALAQYESDGKDSTLEKDLLVKQIDMLSAKLRVFELARDLGQLKLSLVAYRQNLDALDAELKFLRWKALQEKLQIDKQNRASRDFEKRKQEAEAERSQLESQIFALEEEKVRLDTELDAVRKNPPAEESVLIENLTALENKQAFANLGIDLIREQIEFIKLQLSVDFLLVETARIRSELANPNLTLEGLRKLDDYTDELWQTAWSEETMIRSREELFKITSDIIDLSHHDGQKEQEFQALFRDELKQVAVKKDALRDLRKELKDMLSKRPELKLGYREPLKRRLSEWSFWLAVFLLMGVGSLFIGRLLFLRRNVKEAEQWVPAVKGWLRFVAMTVAPALIIFLVCFALGWKNWVSVVARPALIVITVIYVASFLRRLVAVGIYHLQTKRQGTELGKFQSILFVRTFLDFLIWGAAIWATVKIFDLSLESPVITETLPILKYPLVNTGQFQLTLMGIVKGVIAFLFFLYLSRSFRLFLSDYLFPRTTVDTGVRNAVQTLSHYIFIILGITVAISVMGIDLTTLTVFAGALGVGIGFGLQNIANNFISGLILLFERPIKNGDYIQVGKEAGQVQKIGARSTIVKTPDNIFLVVPNANLVSQEVINWTHRDARTRVHLPITVAHHSDLEKVEQLCLQIAASCSQVLAFPAPALVFTRFGESALHLELLVWVDHPLVGVSDELNRKLLAAFRNEGISIPFPQHDIHIKEDLRSV